MSQGAERKDVHFHFHIGFVHCDDFMKASDTSYLLPPLHKMMEHGCLWAEQGDCPLGHRSRDGAMGPNPRCPSRWPAASRQSCVALGSSSPGCPSPSMCGPAPVGIAHTLRWEQCQGALEGPQPRCHVMLRGSLGWLGGSRSLRSLHAACASRCPVPGHVASCPG